MENELEFKKKVHMVLILFLITKFMDVGTTYVGLMFPTIHEVNPILEKYMILYGVEATLLGVAFIGILIFLAGALTLTMGRHMLKITFSVFLLLTILNIYAVINNILVIWSVI